MAKSILIIGAGVTGLAAGCYARMNGYQTTILEQHTQPGGLCTAWSREGYTFDYSISYLMGTAPGSGLYRMWEELGALHGQPIRYFDEFGRFQSEDGKSLILYTDPDRLERHLLELAPVDAKQIRLFTQALRVFAQHPIALPAKPIELMTLMDKVRQVMSYIPLGKYIGTLGSLTTESFAARFQDPFLRRAFARIFTWPDVPLMGLLMALSDMHNHASGKPSGSSLDFARAIEQRYRTLDGEIRYRAPVVQILVENDRAVGVRLQNGTELRADVVISTADGRRTIFDMLGGKYVNDRIRGFYRNLPIYQPVVSIGLGVNRDLSGEPACVISQSEQPLIDAGERPTVLWVKHFCADPSMAPQGKSTIMVEYTGSYAFWQQLHADRAHYRLEKERVAEAAIALLEQRYPGIRTQIEVVDVATPMTVERYTGNYHGSPMGWNLPVTREMSSLMQSGLTRTLPGLANFYMAGQWAPSGGVPAVATWARHLIQLLCHQDGQAFVTTLPETDTASEATA